MRVCMTSTISFSTVLPVCLNCIDRRGGKRAGQASAAARRRPGGQTEGSPSGPGVTSCLPDSIHTFQHRLLDSLHRTVLALTARHSPTHRRTVGLPIPKLQKWEKYAKKMSILLAFYDYLSIRPTANRNY